MFLQGGLASVRTSVTSCWSSSPSCGNMVMCPTTSSAAMTPRRLRIYRHLSRHQRSLPCSIRKLAWWSHRAPGNTLSRPLNCVLTCLTKHTSEIKWVRTAKKSNRQRELCLVFYLLFWRNWFHHVRLSMTCLCGSLASTQWWIISGSRIVFGSKDSQ